MKVEVVENIHITNAEKNVLDAAVKILKDINKDLIDATYLVDTQEFPDAVEKLIKEAITLEDKRVFSRFNELSDEERGKLRRSI